MHQVVVDEAKLAEIVSRLVDAVDPDRIILFGSRSRGDVHSQSDVDLLIVKPSSEPRHRRVGQAHRALIGVGVPIDILWYTPDEAEHWSQVKFHVAGRAMREGHILYEREP